MKSAPRVRLLVLLRVSGRVLRVEITGLDTEASVYMADFEDESDMGQRGTVE
jgi:hypothetical protein